MTMNIPDLFTRLNLGYIQLNATHYTFANEHFCEILGYTEDELKSKPYDEFIFPDDRNHAVKRHKQALDNFPTSYYIMRYLHKNGEPISLIWFADGNYDTGTSQAFCIDVTTILNRVGDLEKKNQLMKDYIKFLKDDTIKVV